MELVALVDPNGRPDLL